MEERRRIIIPTSVEPQTQLPAPHFDEEATLLARPVVPLTEAKQSPSRTKLLLALVVFAALLVGAAGALAFDYFRNHARQNAQVSAEPVTVHAPQATEPAAQPTKVSDREATAAPAKPKPSPAERADNDNGSWAQVGPAERTTAKKSKTERRRKNDNQYEPEEVQRQIERAGRELNRIREIFEGRQGPPEE